MTGSPACILAGPSHASLLSELHSACFEEDERWNEDAFSGLFATPGIMAWVIVADEDPAGLLMLRQSADEAEILTLGVHPRYRRKNLAAQLLVVGCAALRARDVSTLFLEVSVRNDAATALYLKHGFILCGRRKAYYPDGSDASVLSYDLTSVMR
ncbi:GNAT family N-acetyltransferase [Asaia spathodeae]|uniref:GNAT family N-acetyltransferase n=1 Tax=Asaia spathodeae TaxID=657016 RepID=UPI002FC36CEE